MAPAITSQRRSVAEADKRPELHKLQRHRQHWRQFSLRALLVLMLVSGIASGWLAIRMGQARRQTLVVEQLRHAGVYVGFAHHYQASPDPPGPAWARRLLSEDFFREVTVLSATSPVKAIELDDIHIFSKLREVFLNNANADDQTLEKIARSPSLEVLYLGDTSITDAGMQHLANCKELRAAVLWDTTIGDKSVPVLARLPKLGQLYLQRTKITNSGVAKLPLGLTELNVSGTLLSKATAEHIAAMKRLKRLMVRDAQLSDRAALELMALDDLEFLDVTGNELTEETIAMLSKRLPDCTIRR